MAASWQTATASGERWRHGHHQRRRHQAKAAKAKAMTREGENGWRKRENRRHEKYRLK